MYAGSGGSGLVIIRYRSQYGSNFT
jgi:hypothetical protein